MVHKTKRQNGNSPLISQLTTKGALADGFRELMSGHMIAVALTSSVVIACTMALVGPIGFDHRENPLQRVAYALLYIGLCWPVFHGQIVLVYYFMRLRRPPEILAVLVLAMLLASFQGGAVAHTVEGLTDPDYELQSGFLRVFLLFAAVSVSCAMLYFYLIWQRVGGHAQAGADNEVAAEPPAAGATGQPLAADANGISRSVPVAAASGDGDDQAGELSAAPASEATAAEETAPGTRQLVPFRTDSQSLELFKLLPDGLGTDLVFIKSEDHYLEVHTTAGSSLIKMRFSDAIAELGERGLKVHRSYWVAVRHVTRSVRTGKRTVLRLTGDHRVPVSMTHLRAVRALLAR